MRRMCEVCGAENVDVIVVEGVCVCEECLKETTVEATEEVACSVCGRTIAVGEIHNDIDGPICAHCMKRYIDLAEKVPEEKPVSAETLAYISYLFM